MKWLDEHYDATAQQEYSFVRADFKYNEELTQVRSPDHFERV